MDAWESLAADFRLWLLLGQAHREDRVGKAAELILTRPCCDDACTDERELMAHVARDHRRTDVLALLAAVREWRRDDVDA